MYGAILGDIIGSPYEFDQNNIKTTDFELFSERSEFTDDSIMTLAVAEGLMNCGIDADETVMKKSLVEAMKKYGKRYPFAGYGANFSMWLDEEDPQPYRSFGNGSAMRVSAAAWLCQESLQKMLQIAAVTAEVSHNHPEGIKGAQATAAVIFMALHGASKEDIKNTVSKVFGYDLTRTCDMIRPSYHHVESCQETVPEAITAFLEGDSFESVIRLAVSLGGDSDTLACIAGSMAEAFYGVPEELKREARERLSDDLRGVLDRFDRKLEEDREARESDPARMKAWKKALRPAPPVQKNAPKFPGSEELEKSLEEFAADRNREKLVRCMEALRRAMHAGGNVLFPVQPVRVDGTDGKAAGRAIRMKLIATKDGKNWQVAYTSENRYKSGSSAKDPALAATIRQALEQYAADAPGTNKAPDNIAGIVLNPEKNPIFLTREMIASVLNVEARVQRASRSGILVTKGDITKMTADCIVNAANCSLLGGGGVDGAIHRAAGPDLLEECRKLDGCHTGEAKITGGYNLPAKYVIHTVGPIYDGDEDDPKLLASCYRNSLDIAMKNNIHSIVFPNISTGVYGYPKEEAARIAMGTVGRWLSDHKGYVMHVAMCCFDRENYEIYEKLVKSSQNKDQNV